MSSSGRIEARAGADPDRFAAYAEELVNLRLAALATQLRARWVNTCQTD
jgi:hypothetical protein